MTAEINPKSDRLTVLYKGGRLPTWHKLSQDKRLAYEQTHVDHMLSVAQEQRLSRIEGFRLLAPQKNWERFWLIDFPSLSGAEAWITAEMAPPYGSYGYYEYDLARSWRSDELAQWAIQSKPVVPIETDPHQIPILDADHNSIVILIFERWLPEAEAISAKMQGDASYQSRLRSIAHEYGLMRLEAFRLIGAKSDWHQVWVAEFPTLAGAESWINTVVSSPYGCYKSQVIYLARKWAPAYFAAWVP